MCAKNRAECIVEVVVLETSDEAPADVIQSSIRHTTSSGTIVGIVLGVFLGALLCLMMLVIVYRRRNKKKAEEKNDFVVELVDASGNKH